MHQSTSMLHPDYIPGNCSCVQTSGKGHLSDLTLKFYWMHWTHNKQLRSRYEVSSLLRLQTEIFRVLQAITTTIIEVNNNFKEKTMTFEVASIQYLNVEGKSSLIKDSWSWILPFELQCTWNLFEVPAQQQQLCKENPTYQSYISRCSEGYHMSDRDFCSLWSAVVWEIQTSSAHPWTNQVLIVDQIFCKTLPACPSQSTKYTETSFDSLN